MFELCRSRSYMLPRPSDSMSSWLGLGLILLWTPNSLKDVLSQWGDWQAYVSTLQVTIYRPCMLLTLHPSVAVMLEQVSEFWWIPRGLSSAQRELRHVNWQAFPWSINLRYCVWWVRIGIVKNASFRSTFPSRSPGCSRSCRLWMPPSCEQTGSELWALWRVFDPCPSCGLEIDYPFDGCICSTAPALLNHYCNFLSDNQLQLLCWLVGAVGPDTCHSSDIRSIW